MIYVFDDCELDTHLYEFRKHNDLLPLEPKVFDVLVYLIQNHERVVTKEELLTNLWPSQYISEATLNHAVMSARKATGDTGRLQRVIRTLRGRGYRFVAALSERESATGTPLEMPQPSLGSGQIMPTVDPAVARPEAAPREPAEAQRALPGERKPVTVLSCALANTTELMEDVGPDAVHHLLQHLFAMAEEQMRRFDGTITHFMDGSLLALFGAPIAYEDHARRAALAALGLQQRLASLHAELTGPLTSQLQVRMGLHTGLVLIGSIGTELRMTSTAIDGTTDIAVRCQQHAPIGSIMVSETTSRLIQDEVRLERADPLPAMPPSDPFAVFRVVARQRRQSTLGQDIDPSRSPFVGRSRELAALSALFDQAAEGAGQVVGLVAEPGMGKSRLLQEFCQRIEKDRAHYLEGHCLSYGSSTPYLPVIDVIRQVWGIVEGDPHDAIIANVQEGLEQAGIASDENLAYLLNLLGVQESPQVLSHLTPEAIKARTLAVLRQLCFDASREQPLIIAVEDLHWIDASSEQFLTSLVEYLAGSPILLVVTYRPGYQPPWMGTSYSTQMTITRLTSEDSLSVIRSIEEKTHVSNLPTQEIVAKAAGNPFFLEELTQALAEQSTVDPTITVPDTIQAVLSARIDRLSGPNKHLLQTAAVIGKDVPSTILQAIADLSDAELDEALHSLQTAEFLHEKRDSLEPAFTFRHALTQEVAYQSLLASTRRQLHQRIAVVLETQPPESLANQLELLAHHYTEAGLHDRAVATWRQAGQRAIARSAHREAASHFSRGLAVLTRLPESTERLQTELTFQMALGAAYMGARGYGAPEVDEAYQRALTLSNQLNNDALRIATLFGLWAVANTRAEHETARNLATQCLTLAEPLDASSPLLRSHLALGMSQFYLGEIAQAHHHLDQSLALYDPDQRRRHSDIQDPKVGGLSNTAFTLWLQGYPAAALARSEEALDMARHLQHPFSLAFALAYATALHQHRRDPIRVAALAKELLVLAEDQGFTFFAGPAHVYQGWARTEAGDITDSIAEIKSGLEAFQATQAKLHLPHLHMLLVEAYRHARQTDAGLAVLQECRVLTEQTQERWSEAEIDRLAGTLLLRQSNPDEGEAERHFQRAIDIAHRQGAKMLELRAATNLCQLWHRQGKKEPASRLLSPLYKWFTEGHDTVDLRAAKALLDI